MESAFQEKTRRKRENEKERGKGDWGKKGKWDCRWSYEIWEKRKPTERIPYLPHHFSRCLKVSLFSLSFRQFHLMFTCLNSGEKSIICVCLPFSPEEEQARYVCLLFSREKYMCGMEKMKWAKRGVQVQVCLLHTRLDKRARMSDNLVRKAWMREKSIDCSRDDLHSFLPPLVSVRCCCYCRFAFVTWRETHNKVLPEWISLFPFFSREKRMSKVTLTDKNRPEREDIQFVNYH